jgi:shikimate kinase
VQASRNIRNVALIGFMGTGKSSVGHVLSGMLDFQMVDTDALIEGRAGQPITEIFRTMGEARFREYEREMVEELSRMQRVVIATGGGLGANPHHLALLKTHALVACLWASPEMIWQRVRHQAHRPLLEGPDPFGRIQRLLTERAPVYRQADLLINTELRSVREVAHQIAHHFGLSRESAPA